MTTGSDARRVPVQRPALLPAARVVPPLFVAAALLVINDSHHLPGTAMRASLRLGWLVGLIVLVLGYLFGSYRPCELPSGAAVACERGRYRSGLEAGHGVVALCPCRSWRRALQGAVTGAHPFQARSVSLSKEHEAWQRHNNLSPGLERSAKIAVDDLVAHDSTGAGRLNRGRGPGDHELADRWSGAVNLGR